MLMGFYGCWWDWFFMIFSESRKYLGWQKQWIWMLSTTKTLVFQAIKGRIAPAAMGKKPPVLQPSFSKPNVTSSRRFRIKYPHRSPWYLHDFMKIVGLSNRICIELHYLSWRYIASSDTPCLIGMIPGICNWVPVNSPFNQSNDY